MSGQIAVRSLHRRLSWSLGSLAVVVGLLGALGAGVVSHQLANQFNRDLQSAAQTIQVAPQSMPLPSDPSREQPHIVIQSWRPDNDVAPGHTSDVSVVLPRTKLGFSSVTGSAGSVWDVFAVQAGGSLVQIAEQRAVRTANAWRVAAWAAMPVILLLPLLVWVVRATVRVSLRPLGEMGERVARVDLDHLEPVLVDTAPEELHPFLTSINRMMVRLSALVAAERRFIADAAHELRSPITAMQLQADNLRDAPPGTFDERIELLYRGIRRTATLVSQLLGLARAEVGANAAAPSLSLPAVVSDVVVDLVPLALDRGVDLGVEQLDDVTLHALETDLRMLVKNLIDNAIRYGGPGCRVDVRVIAGTGAHFGTQMEGAIIEVADDGPGIPEAKRERVFDRFYRAGATDEEGSGLGLAIARAVAGNLGGRVELASRPDGSHGLVARIVLPNARATSPTEAPIP